ncbi:MAG: TetR/AcrR family transcriptional regulator [Alphaproteobacteria bacterium]|nr:TetR/AcrR family transcriptional regulator [Alphaproteobacteria bacterium]
MARQPYRSKARAQAAEDRRRAVLASASRCFAERGIDGVTIAELAADAGVGVSTVYAYFESKEGIVRALMQQALFGARYRAEAARLDQEGDPVLRIAGTAAVACAIYEGEAEALGLLRGASAFAPSLRAIEEEFEALRYTMQESRITALHEAGLLAPELTVDEARRILWALTGRDVFRNLVGIAGWSPARFRSWLAKTLVDQLVAPERSNLDRRR